MVQAERKTLGQQCTWLVLVWAEERVRERGMDNIEPLMTL